MRGKELIKRPVLLALMTLASLLTAMSGIVPAQQKQKLDFAAAAEGRSSFRIYCSSCHGKGAKGDGSLAKDLKAAPADLTQISKRNDGEYPFEMVSQRIDGRKDGKRRRGSLCPVWGEAFLTTDDEEHVKRRIYELTHFLWSIQEKSKR